MEYPKEKDYRSGIKVAWLYYVDKETANEASRLAEKEAQRKAELGYDFGYQRPGNVRYCESGPYAGLWEVCIP